MSVYLGLDSSTQSLSVVAIRVEKSRREVVYEKSLYFDEAFPAYKTVNGALPSDDPFLARSPPKMWAEALDALLAIIAKEGGFPLEEVRAISGSGQQHGSVYLNASAEATLGKLNPDVALVDQIANIFSRENSPIWMDSSTARQCQEITDAVGGAGVLAMLTGSCAFERFTGPQIRKYYEQDPDGYERTARIHLVSSFMASLLAGKHAPIDPGDGSGMNLMDLARRTWATTALQATAPNLLEKLPAIEDSWSIVGPLSDYWVRRHGYSPETKVVAWSGDNPCSLIGVGLVKPGRVAVSLGTSDTLFGFMPVPRVDPLGVGHVFGSPTGDFMCLICFKNGSLARQRIRDDYGMDWEAFSSALERTKPGNQGSVMLPWIAPEITPTVLEPGVRRFGLDPEDGPANVRAVVEAQMTSLCLHSEWMGVKIDKVHATGGAARNRQILKVMADVLGATVYQFEVKNSAGLGAALRAYHADLTARNEPVSWEEVTAGFTEPVAESRIDPDPELRSLYDSLKDLYAACEARAIRGGDDPAPLQEEFRKQFG